MPIEMDLGLSNLDTKLFEDMDVLEYTSMIGSKNDRQSISQKKSYDKRE